jgi:hypothetical protein
MRRPLTPLASGPLAWRGLLVLLLATAAFGQFLMPSALPIPEAPRAPSPPAASGSGRDAPRRMVYAAIAEHPLFDPTRRPYVARKAPAPAPTSARAALRDYTLLGTVIGNGTRIAVLKPPAKGKTVFATEGQAVGGWILRQITPQRVRFANGAARYDMQFAEPRWPDR